MAQKLCLLSFKDSFLELRKVQVMLEVDPGHVLVLNIHLRRKGCISDYRQIKRCELENKICGKILFTEN